MLNSWKRNSYVAAYIHVCITNFLMMICCLNLILDLSSQIFYHAWQEYVLELKRQSRYSILLYLKHNESDSLTFCLYHLVQNMNETHLQWLICILKSCPKLILHSSSRSNDIISHIEMTYRLMYSTWYL
jgi:hypothetical protein